MRVFPGANKIVLKLIDQESFIKKINGIILGDNNPVSSAIFKGKITQNKFSLIRITNYFNAFRPSIKGILKEGYLTMHVSISDFTLNLFLGMNGFFIGSFLLGKIPKIAMVLITMNLMFYILGWIFFLWERKLTKSSWERIIELTKEN